MPELFSPKLFLDKWFENALAQSWASASVSDAAHDLGHVRRVVRQALSIAGQEGAAVGVIRPAAWFHDLVALPKDHPDRRQASRLSADQAVGLLTAAGYSAALLPEIAHAIVAHSFSAGVEPRTLEAKIVQDADRLEALGAIGIARTFAVSGQLGRPLFHQSDPLAVHRPLDDGIYAVDHFFVKLFKVGDTLWTATARAIAASRIAFMRAYLTQLESEMF